MRRGKDDPHKTDNREKTMQVNQTRRNFLKTTGAAATALAGGAGTMAHAQAPFFRMYMMIPNNQPARMIWGTLAAQQISKLGIDVQSSYVPWSVITPRRTNGEGKPHADGGWDAYLERYYYNSITPVPNNLFSSTAFPPNGQNFYYVDDPEIDASLADYAAAREEAPRMEAITRFQKRWYDIQPMTILFYPEDVIATNPKLSGFSGTTFNPVFFPDPENWTIADAGDEASAAFASWQPPQNLTPMYTGGYSDANVFGPVFNRLYEYKDWDSKEIQPALATGHTVSEDGRHWVITLREGVRWHSGEEFTAEDVVFTWAMILNEAYASPFNAPFKEIFASPEAFSATGKYEVTVDLPKFTVQFEHWVMNAMQVMPKHVLEGIAPEDLRAHPFNTWNGTYDVTLSDGSTYSAKGGVGTGPWISEGQDQMRNTFVYTKNPDYWKETPGNVTTYYLVNIQGSDAVLSALRAGEIDAHDPMYDIGSLVDTIDPSWGKVQTYDSYKWQHVCYNLRHPIFGTGVDTPLGREDPSRAAEAAAYVRQAFSHAMPREQIVQEIASGFGAPGTVPMPFTAPEYAADLLKPIEYDLEIAREFMTKAGYVY